MKIANQKPVAMKRPVYVTDDKYALYYARPVMLGEITKGKSGYWFTADGLRFASSRDALEHLIVKFELEHPLPEQYRVQQDAPAVAPAPVKQKGATAAKKKAKPIRTPEVVLSEADKAVLRRVFPQLFKGDLPVKE